MRLRIALLIIFLLVASVIVTLNVFFSQAYQTEMAEEVSKQQLEHVRSIAQGVGNILDDYSMFTAYLAEIAAEDRRKSDVLIEYARRIGHGGIGIGIYLVSSKGEVIFGTDKAPPSNELLLRLNELAAHSGKGKTVMDSSATGNGKLLIISPMISKGGAHEGFALLSLSIVDIHNTYLSQIRIGSRGYAWSMDSRGTLLYHPTKPTMVGSNIFHHGRECYACHQSFRTEEEILASRDTGYRSYISPYGEDKLLSFVRVPETGWIICLSVPKSEVTGELRKSSKLHSMLAVAIFLLMVLGAGVVLIFDRVRLRAESRAKLTEKIAEYAKQLEHTVSERTHELQSEKEKLTAVLSAIEAGISIFDEEYTCVWMNRVMGEWLGGTDVSDSVIFERIYGPIESTKILCDAIIDDMKAEKIAWLDLGRKQGYFHMMTKPFHAPSGACQIMLIIQDVTAIKKAEEQLQQTEKLIALSRLSAGLAHEIGNPLTAISSYIQILSNYATDEFSREALATISKNLGRIEGIIRKMSDFSRTRMHERDFFKIPDLLSSTIDLLRYDKRMKNIEITQDVPEGLPRVFVDGNQIVQIFLNLFFNSADAMRGEGRIDVSVRTEGHNVMMEFSDNGSGISPEHMGRIFEPFYTTKEDGVGLGLAVCMNIIKGFGGDILVRSEEGKGATFTVVLPAHE